KQLRQGLQQLGEEGAIQVFRPVSGGSLLLGAIGTLQFEVVLHRLKSEYNVDARLEPSRSRLARWITCNDANILRKFIDANAHRVGYDVVDAPAFLATHLSELEVSAERYPQVKFHAMREHAGKHFATTM
ncbi:MAG: peptide chain release factor 3, partial [Burkholderiales bacterium]